MIYSVGFTVTDNALNHPALEIVAGATNFCIVLEMGFCIIGQYSDLIGLGRPAAAGVNPVKTLFQAIEDANAPAAKTGIAVSWGTPPTAPTAFFRRFTTYTVRGNGFVLSFGRGIHIPPGGTLVAWNTAVGATFEGWFEIEE